MPAAELDIELDAPAWLVRQPEVAVADLERLRQQLTRPGWWVQAVLERDEVRRSHGDLSRDDRVDGAERVVRSEPAVVDLGHRGDHPCLEHAAAMRQVGLHERRAAELEHLAKGPLREQALAGRD